MTFRIEDAVLGIIGLGYVGLPLAVEFGKQRKVIGYDIDPKRISELSSGHDKTLECSDDELSQAIHLTYTISPEQLKECNVFIVTVPTPIDSYKLPDFSPLIKASEMLGKIIKNGDIVIYESTVYPGATEEQCIPIIEKISNLVFNRDFFAGYSPERINPGDKKLRITNILKITSGSTPETANFVDNLYKTIIQAGTYLASSIKVAEAAKVIENTQRDINIALINEFSIIFNKLGIDTLEVLKAAETKWNFLPFRPGLVGGHCIGVDPYYLIYKAQSVGYQPEMILAGRKLNDNMGKYVVSQLIKAMLKRQIHINNSNILIMGFTFKENCPDLRNTRIVDIIDELKEYNINVDIFDPWCSDQDVQNEYKLTISKIPKKNHYDAIIVSVSHNEFRELGVTAIKSFGKEIHVIYDLKCIFDKDDVDIRL